MIRRPPRSPLFPSTTLFRSGPLRGVHHPRRFCRRVWTRPRAAVSRPDRKSTRLNSSHSQISFIPFFFFNDPATPEISPLSLHDALPIWSTSWGSPSPTLLSSGMDSTSSSGIEARSEEHTSELQSQSNLLYPFFFF